MKKNYFMLAAATMMFAACAETDLVNEVNVVSEPQAIGFETFANKATRAEPTAENSSANYSWDLSDHHKTFMVWGYKNTATVKVFDAVTVSYDEGKTAWDYSDNSVSPVYWDKAATSYEFYAAAPATRNFWTLRTSTDDQDDDFFTTASFTIPSHNQATYQDIDAPTQVINNNEAIDLMIAAKNTFNKSIGEVPTAPVALNFIHILSRLNVTVKAAIEGVKVTNITIGNINSQGTFNESPNNFDEAKLVDGTYSRWTLVEDKEETRETGVDNDGTPIVETYTIPAPMVEYTNNTSKTLTKGEDAVIAIEALVIPQLAGNESIPLNTTVFTNYKEPYIIINYTINNEPYRQVYNLAYAFNGDTSNDVAFNEGWQNTLNLTINGEEITFTGKVATWANGNVNNNPKIN